MTRILYFLILSSFFLIVSCEKMGLEYHEDISCVKGGIEKNLAVLCSREFQGRKTGTRGDSLAFSYIYNYADSLHYNVQTQLFFTDSGTNLRNIIVYIQGANDSLIVIGGHYDAAVGMQGEALFPGANDNASGVVTNMGLLDTLSRCSMIPKYSVLCCFWDAEEYFEGKAFQGSEYFCKTSDLLSKIILYLNLDTIGHEHKNMGIVRSDDVRVADYLKTIPLKYKYTVREPYDGNFSDYYSFKMKGVPYFGFHDHYNTSCGHDNHTMHDKPDFISVNKLMNILECVLDVICNY